jgi:hypothetical protein
VKAVVAILFSLALVLSHLNGFSSPVLQLCQSPTPCGCGDSSCCISTPDTSPTPLLPAPASDYSRLQLVAVVQPIVDFTSLKHELTLRPHFSAPAPVSSAVPAYLRNCVFLI